MFSVVSDVAQQMGLDTRDPLQVGLVLVVGIFLQVYGVKLLVGGGSGLARRFSIPPLIIGSTVVAFGLSAPALFVSAWAAGKGQGDIAVGNAVGCVILNLGLILGISAITRPLRFRPQLFQADVPILVASAALAGYLLRNGVLGKFEATLLIFCLASYMIFLWFSAGVEADTRVISDMERDLPPAGAAKRVELAQCLGGLVLLVAGSRYLVKSAVTASEMIGLSPAVTDLGFIPLAVSSPHIFGTVLAIWKKEKDLAGGVVLGSCIFNCLGVLGISALYRTVFAPGINNFDLGVMLIAAMAVLPMGSAGEKRRQAIGVALLVGYGMYLTQLFGRVAAGSL
jgi:cation:H+ antiporter